MSRSPLEYLQHILDETEYLITCEIKRNENDQNIGGIGDEKNIYWIIFRG